MTEAEIDATYRDTVVLDEAPKNINATYYGPDLSCADRNGVPEPMYGKEGRAWRDERWLKREGIDESSDQRGSRTRYFFLPRGQVRADKNIFIVYADNLQFS
jgi:hypothetical protein